MMDGCTLLEFYWTIEYQHPFTAIIKLGRARPFLEELGVLERLVYILNWEVSYEF